MRLTAFLARKFDINARDCIALRVAIACEQWEVARFLIANGAVMPVDALSQIVSGNVSLEALSLCKMVLLSVTHFDFNSNMHFPFLILMSPSTGVVEEIFVRLLELGLDPNAGSFEGAHTLVHVAVRQAQYSVLKLLVEAGADMSPSSFNTTSIWHKVAESCGLPASMAVAEFLLRVLGNEKINDACEGTTVLKRACAVATGLANT